jgi:hypothetical protein
MPTLCLDPFRGLETFFHPGRGSAPSRTDGPSPEPTAYNDVQKVADRGPEGPFPGPICPPRWRVK